jgi:carboxyl-terminal processing protease
MNIWRRKAPIVRGTGLGALLFASAWLGGCSAKPSVRVADEAWTAVREHYFDGSFNGFDWDAVRRRVVAQASKARSQTDLYWTVINPMLQLLETSHLAAQPPGRASAPGPRMEVMEPSWGRCLGVTITYGRRPILSRVLTVQPDTTLARLGLRVGWRYLGVDELNSETVARFIALDGSEADFALRSFSGADAAALREGWQQLVVLRERDKRPTDELNFEKLGIRLTEGSFATAPMVADVAVGSQALRMGLVPGQTIVSISDKLLDNGRRFLSGRAAYEDGRSVDFATAYKCTPTDNLNHRSAELRKRTLIVRFEEYDAGLADWLANEISTQKPASLILDLRNNRGGSVEEMRKVLGLLVEPGTVIGFVRSRGSNEPLRVIQQGTRFDGPITVLIGLATASAAEVTALALRVHRAAPILGNRSAGEAVISNSFRLSDGGTLQIATADFLGADRQRIEGVGVAPDVTVLSSSAQLAAGYDSVLESALSLRKNMNSSQNRER